MSDDKVIKTFVWHNEECFFISTITRDSSAIEGGRYNETMVWKYDWRISKRGDLVGQFESAQEFIGKHQEVVNKLFHGGPAALKEAE